MRVRLASLGLCVLTSILTMAGAAQADNEFDVSVSSGKVVVTAKGQWHINKDYPWKLVSGDTKIDKSKFAMTDTQATLNGAPKGAAHLKGAVCSGDQCKPFDKEIAVP